MGSCRKVLALPDDEFTLDEKRMYCTGRLGLVETGKFFAWLKDKMKYQSWREILIDGKDFKTDTNGDLSSEVFWAVQIACLSAIANEKDDKICRKYVLNFIKATNKLKSKIYKGFNIAALVKIPRINNTEIFDPMNDARELLSLISNVSEQLARLR